MKFTFGLQHPLTCKPLNNPFEPWNKLRGEYFSKEVLPASLSLCRCKWLYNNTFTISLARSWYLSSFSHSLTFSHWFALMSMLTCSFYLLKSDQVFRAAFLLIKIPENLEAGFLERFLVCAYIVLSVWSKLSYLHNSQLITFRHPVIPALIFHWCQLAISTYHMVHYFISFATFYFPEFHLL